MSTEMLFMMVILVVILMVIIAVMLFLMNNIRESKFNRYNEELKRIEHDKMREYFESKIYELNMELTEDKKRWKETNHLVISGSNNNIDNNNIHKSVLEENNFLSKHGITKMDREIDKKDVFVLTSFMDEYRDTYSAIKSTCDKVGLNCSKSDDEYIEGDILKHILKKIAKARIIIANIDGRNPNVFYELGIVHALDKPTVVISKNKNEVPFDLRSKNIVFYTDLKDLQENLLIEINKIALNK